jgi:tartrate dehydrogenase/decarboxylase / D-malate dehydrogenase
MMLDDLGEADAAAAVMRAIEDVLAAREVRTPDLGGHAGTRELTDALLAALRSPSCT